MVAWAGWETINSGAFTDLRTLEKKLAPLTHIPVGSFTEDVLTTKPK